MRSAVGELQKHSVNWFSGPATDTIMAFSWVPFTLLAILIEDAGGALRVFMLYVLFFSFSHQPLTLVLVYGDKARFALRSKLFTWSPLVFGIAVLMVVNFSPLLLAVAAGLWNAEHTVMQRYGIMRIYGRMVGQNTGGVELYLLFSWFLLAIVWAAADPANIQSVLALDLGDTNTAIVGLVAGLGSLASLLKPFALAATILLLLKWFREELRRKANRAKQLYCLSTMMLFTLMMFHPVAGLIGGIGAHAFEYFVIVNRSLGNQYKASSAEGGLLGGAVRARTGRAGFFVFYLLVIAGILFLLENYANLVIYTLVMSFLGALHFFYDMFIWKLRQPGVARNLGAIDHAA